MSPVLPEMIFKVAILAVGEWSSVGADLMPRG
jgi:hypothetical protein